MAMEAAAQPYNNIILHNSMSKHFVQTRMQSIRERVTVDMVLPTDDSLVIQVDSNKIRMLKKRLVSHQWFSNYYYYGFQRQHRQNNYNCR